jgi:hypothetical protein
MHRGVEESGRKRPPAEDGEVEGGTAHSAINAAEKGRTARPGVRETFVGRKESTPRVGGISSTGGAGETSVAAGSGERATADAEEAAKLAVQVSKPASTAVVGGAEGTPCRAATHPLAVRPWPVARALSRLTS